MWILRVYKMPDGKPENNFAFDGEYQDAEFAYKIISETNLFWKQLVGLEEPLEDPGKLCIGTVLCEGAKEMVTREEASEVLGNTAEYVGFELESSPTFNTELMKSRLPFLGHPRDLTSRDVYRHVCRVCDRVFHKSHGLVSHVSDHHPHLLKKLQEDLSI